MTKQNLGNLLVAVVASSVLIFILLSYFTKEDDTILPLRISDEGTIRTEWNTDVPAGKDK